MKFQPGQSGNKAGRPRGKPNKITNDARRILNNNAVEVLEAAIENAKNGDVQAQRLVLSLALPRRIRESIAIPELNTIDDVNAALVAVAQAAAAGNGEPEEIRAMIIALEAVQRQITPANDIQQFFDIVMQAVEEADPATQKRIMAKLTATKLDYAL